MNVFPLKIGQTASLKNFNLYIIVLLIIFFPLLVWITGENRTKMNKLFIWTTKSGRAQHLRKNKKQNKLHLTIHQQLQYC